MLSGERGIKKLITVELVVLLCRGPLDLANWTETIQLLSQPTRSVNLTLYAEPGYSSNLELDWDKRGFVCERISTYG